MSDLHDDYVWPDTGETNRQRNDRLHKELLKMLRKYYNKIAKQNQSQWGTVKALCQLLKYNEDIPDVLDRLVEAAQMYQANENREIFRELWKAIPDAMKHSVQKAMMQNGVINGNFWLEVTGKFPPPPPQDSAFCVYENNPYIVSSTSSCVSGSGMPQTLMCARHW